MISIVEFPFGVYISQLIRYYSDCVRNHDFLDSWAVANKESREPKGC